MIQFLSGMGLKLGLQCRRKKGTRHVLMLHILKIAHDLSRAQSVQPLDHLPRIGSVFSCDGSLHNRLLYFSRTIFLRGHNSSFTGTKVLNEIVVRHALMPCFRRKNNTSLISGKSVAKRQMTPGSW